MSNKSMAIYSCSMLLALSLSLLLLLLLPDAAVAAATTTATRSARIAANIDNSNNNNKPLTEPKLAAAMSKAATATAAAATVDGKLKTSGDSNNNANSKYEIRAVAGEPNYKSVNLTWEVEFVTSPHDTDTNTDANVNAPMNRNLNVNSVTNMSDDVEPPKAFQIFYCEMQNYGPQRCRVKLVNGTAAVLQPPNAEDVVYSPQHFATAVDNLRMATRYSFHIRPVQPRRLRSNSGRAEFHDENEIEGAGTAAGHLPGQSIIIPTKGFSAHATQCLAHASEIEVETGPYFGGRIVVDGGDCGIKGNANDPADKYTMRIDHKLCGSMVKPETNTVETFITVQENLGIFTHSTRRFVVVCSYQSGMQTVRASFTVPGKNAGVAAAVESNDPFQPDDERLGRELRHMRFVDKSELVLKESAQEMASEMNSDSDSVEMPAIVVETQPPESEQLQQKQQEQEQQVEHEQQQHQLQPQRQQGRALSLASLNEVNNMAELNAEEEAPAQGRQLEQLSTKYAKLVVDQGPGHGYNGAMWTSAQSKADANDDEFYVASLRYISANLGSVLVTVSISVIIISICIVLLQRQRLQNRNNNNNNNNSKSNTKKSHLASLSYPSTHLPHKTLPRALQQQQYQCTL